jgi:hypothetical protein
MAGGGARRGTLVIHYGTGHRRPASRPRQPRDGTGSCGSQPAYQSLIDRRLQHRPLPCATFNRLLAAELIGRRTLMPRALETGHESGSVGMSLNKLCCPFAWRWGAAGIIFQEAARLHGQRPPGDHAMFTLIQRCLCGILGACTPSREKAKTTQTVADAPAPVGREPKQPC